MFQTDTVTAVLSSVNPRAEVHGDDQVPAVDFGLTFDSPNAVLEHFGPQLLPSLYAKAAARDAAPAAAQGELEAVAPVSVLPYLRNPTIDSAIKVRFEGVGYAVRFDHGLGGESDIVFAGVKVNNVRLTAKEGGTVSVALRVQVTEPEADAIGRLCQRVGQEVTVSLTPPASEQPKLEAKPAKRGKANRGEQQWPFPQETA